MLIKILRPFLGRKCLFPIYNAMYKLSLRGMNIGLGDDVRFSGEKNVLSYVKKHSIKRGEGKLIVFDVGANKGQYTNTILNFFNDNYIEIHCFEPGHETFLELSDDVGRNSNVTLNNFGLSDSQTEGILYFDEAGSGLASLYKRQLDYFDINFEKSESVSLDTLDNYVKTKNIEAIDLLKLDVEGNELNVLNGSTKTLAQGKIKAIQIEFGGCNIDSRTFIRDFWNLLHENFIMYRIMKDGLIEIKKYQETLEIFSCTNFFFAKR